MNRILIISFLLLSGAALAAPNREGKVVDMGEMEVFGEVRKPLIDVVDADKYLLDNVLPKVAEDRLKHSENSLFTKSKTGPSASINAFESKTKSYRSLEKNLLDTHILPGEVK